MNKLWILVLVGAALSGCDGEAAVVGSDDQPMGEYGPPIGTPCILPEEADPTFTGFDGAEIIVDDHHDGCQSGTCLVHHLQGRASCPYGQTAAEVATGGRCFRPYSTDLVRVPVRPQLSERPASKHSICSCRCGGPGPGPFCECGAGMECAQLVDVLGLDADELSGSYCIPEGTRYDATAARHECDRATMSCGNDQPFAP